VKKFREMLLQTILFVGFIAVNRTIDQVLFDGMLNLLLLFRCGILIIFTATVLKPNEFVENNRIEN